ncbi:DUF927 domain-containing protein [Gluconacetobacter sp. 1b LMG 1731]|uniref:DUF927 domain-containing protein n=1 Tax=Gluconacetobacter dulcium TaxID=2729096 RepID=A0A7W4NUV2_9PROT|nr:DUF927 domain-containing protein [Gluconacetobacter dulcium]MBB2164683.1 DUF927 domain-containing protein [Gluconacetobacter dulcium]MBB2193819.1 DUF927 domain-containing protein [Gluconacetobacter dulcium]
MTPSIAIDAVQAPVATSNPFRGARRRADDAYDREAADREYSTTEVPATQTNIVRLPPRTVSPLPVAAPSAPPTETGKSGKASKSKPKPARPGELVPQIPARHTPTRDTLQRLAPTDLHVYNNAEQDTILAVAECEAGRKIVIYGTKDDRAGWHVIDNDTFNKLFPRRPLYGMDTVAQSPSLPVIVVSNERAAKAAQAMHDGVIFVSVMPGSLAKTDWTHLRDREVIVWPDAGDAGLRDAREIAVMVDADQPADGAAPLVRIVSLPEGLPDGWALDQPAPEGVEVDVAALIAGAVEPGQVGLDAGVTEKPIFPAGYEMTPEGLVFLRPAYKAGMPDTEVQVTTRPFEIVAAVDSRSASDAGLLLNWRSDQGRVREFVAPKREITNAKSDLFSDMAGLGFGYNPAASTLLRTFFMTIKCTAFTQITDRTGWCVSQSGAFDAFVMPGGEVIGGDEERLIFKNDNVDAETLKSLHAPSGTLEDWQNSVAAYAVGNSRLIFTISAAFASPLLPILKQPGGGFHFYGASSRGKTTAIIAGASVWGDVNYPNSTIVKKWRSTANSMEGLLERVSGTCAFLDEATNAPGRTIGEIVYMAADGEGKNRATRDVGLRKNKTFQLVFVSNGEKDLSEMIAADSGMITGGQDIRMPSINAICNQELGAFDTIHDAPSPASFSKFMVDICEKFHGTAGRRFIEELIQEMKTSGIDYVLDVIGRLQHDFREKFVSLSADGQVSRVADRFALVAAAGELAIWLGVLPWEPGAAADGVGRVYLDWLRERGGEGSREEINLIKALREFLMRHGFRRFESLRRTETALGGGSEGTADDYVSPVVDCIGYRDQVGTNNETVFYDFIIPAINWDNFIRDELKVTAISGADAAKAIRDAGFMKIGAGKGLTMKRTLPGKGRQVGCYMISHDILNDDAETSG